jgi:ABC-type lipoprotein export system ATPase subunit
MSKILVKAENVGMEFVQLGGERVRVLAAIDCEVVKGEKIAVVGASGSGKSTLLHILGGLITPTSGRVSWPGLGEQSTLQPGKVSYVFQAPSLFPALNILENVILPRRLMGRDADDRQAAQKMLEQLGIGALATKLPEELSGGQSQRVAMARALVVEPELVLADEPTGQLDSHTARDFLDAVLAIADASGTAMMIATHDPLTADRMNKQWSIEHGHLDAKRRLEASVE